MQPWDGTGDRHGDGDRDRDGDREGDRTILCGRNRSYVTTSVAEAGLRRRDVDLGPPKATCQPSGDPRTSPALWGPGDGSSGFQP